MEEEHKKRNPLQFVVWILKVLYSPLKAFEEIAKKPDIKGPILILLITLPITMGVQYVSGANFFLERPFPEKDLWTEEPSAPQSFLWAPESGIVFNSTDHVEGNFSVSTAVLNSAIIQMQLTGIGNLNISKEEYSHLSFRLKWIHPANEKPNSATLQLFSLNNTDDRFELDIEPLIANSTDIWGNVTSLKSLDLTNTNYVREGSPTWENITGIGFQLAWEDQADITLRIDELFFGRYEDLTSSNSLGVLLPSIMRSGINFLVEWIILSAIAFLALKSFANWTGQWKNLWLVVGYVYASSIVYLMALLSVSFFLPPIFLPYTATYAEYVNLQQSAWGLPVSILGLANYVWTTVLCTIALKKVNGLGWTKAFFMGFGAVVMALLLGSFLLQFLGI
ncbi:MAG: YIP1 family protein [Candidatus Bathyarchaeota archaeon]|nr:YIP1 family protein [Candidatus Bathyarchaeota archaeon]